MKKTLLFSFFALFVSCPVLAVQASPISTSLTLDEAYRLALKQSEDVAISRETLGAAEGHFYQAFQVILPKIDYAITRTEQQAVSGGSADTTTANALRRSTPLQKFTLNQPIFSGFKEFAAFPPAGAGRKA